MNVAVWNFPPADLLTTGMTSGERSHLFAVESLPPVECERALLESRVDLALLPTVSILKHHQDLDVVPAVALSTWRYPFAKLAVSHDLSKSIRVVAFDPDFEQERVLAAVLLREHYRMEPEFVAATAGLSDAGTIDHVADARLHVGPDVPMQNLDGRVLDLGQEWYELANYPMTWGLFAARKGTLATEAVREVRDAVGESERRRNVWLRTQKSSENLHDFYSESMRFRLDDLCVAGLTELRQYLFYYDVVDDVREIPFMFIPDDEGQDQEREPLL